MTIQQVDIAVGDDQGSLTKTATGSLAADHIVRVTYQDSAIRDKITQLEG